MENYLMLNGKRINLTAEQIETLVGKKEKDPFERAEGETFFYIDFDGRVEPDEDCLTAFDNDRYVVGNYCTDKELMKQRALHVILSQKLWRYSMQHGGREINKNGEEWKATILYDRSIDAFCTSEVSATFSYAGELYFKNKDIAEAAIEEIVKPFMEQHPEFRW